VDISQRKDSLHPPEPVIRAKNGSMQEFRRWLDDHPLTFEKEITRSILGLQGFV
jgi:hypothetical protein